MPRRSMVKSVSGSEDNPLPKRKRTPVHPYTEADNGPQLRSSSDKKVRVSKPGSSGAAGAKSKAKRALDPVLEGSAAAAAPSALQSDQPSSSTSLHPTAKKVAFSHPGHTHPQSPVTAPVACRSLSLTRMHASTRLIATPTDRTHARTHAPEHMHSLAHAPTNTRTHMQSCTQFHSQFSHARRRVCSRHHHHRHHHPPKNARRTSQKKQLKARRHITPEEMAANVIVNVEQQVLLY